MRWTRTIIFSLTAAYLASCSERVPTGPEAVSMSGSVALLPSPNNLDSAKLLVHSCHSDSQAVVVHPQQAPWSESSVNWDQIGPVLSPFVLGTFRARDTGWVRVDVSGLVKLWLDGVWANNGIVLDQNAPEYLRTNFDSRESRGHGPRLILYYSVADSSPVFSFAASGDARIDASFPLENYGTDSLLQTGWTNTEPGERRTLIAFDLSSPETAPVSRLGDRVWFDSNADGVQSEEGMPGIAIQLLNCEGAVLASTTTDSTGHYLFDSLDAGSYVIAVESPAGFLFSPANAGSSDSLDSDADPGTGRSSCIVLGEGEENLTIDAGLVREPEPEPRCAVGDRVWLDLDRDGLQEDSEPGLPLVAVSLHSCSQEHELLAVTTTDADGHYRFGNLVAGHYQLQFHKPDGYEFSQQGAGELAANSDAQPETGFSDCIELSPGEEDLTVDAGLNTPEPEPDPVSALGDRVWLDENRNGVQDDGEEGAADVRVMLLNCDGSTLADTRTDASGHYQFDSLPAGSYRVRFLAPDGMEFSHAGGTVDSERDSDPNPATGVSSCIALAAGVNDMSHDAGLCHPDVDPTGCTHSRLWWRDHASRHGDPDLVSRYLPIWLGTEGGAKSVRIADSKAAVRVLCYMGRDFHGLNRLAGELLAARLNEAAGASAEVVQDVLNAVDTFFAGTSGRDWAKLNQSQRRQVEHWRRALQNWNEGKTGPGSCSE